MLRALLIALLVATAAAFTAPISSRGAVSRVSSVSMDGSWRRSYDGKGGVAPAAASAAPSGSMSVAQACVFLQSAGVASTPFAAKKAFLESKGVSTFVISQAACTTADTTLVL